MKLLKAIGAALVASTAAGSAFAADLPARKAPPVYVAPAPVFTWTGFYVGLNAGYGWLDRYDFSAWGQTGSQGGFVGGGQIGYNWQVSPMFVVGAEADFQGSSIGHNNNTNSTWFGGVNTWWGSAVTRRVDWFGTIRGRVGVTLFNPQLLLYGTGGFAFGDLQFANSGWWWGGSTKTTATGWTAGAGLEYAFTPNWSAKVEYLFTDIGTNYQGWSGWTWAVGPTGNQRVHINTIRAGVNYRFNWGAPAPVVAKY